MHLVDMRDLFKNFQFSLRWKGNCNDPREDRQREREFMVGIVSYKVLRLSVSK